MSREKGLHGCISSLRVLLEGSSALWVHRRVYTWGLEPGGWFQRLSGDVLSHTSDQASSNQTSWISGLSAGPGSLEGGDGASEPRSSGWK